MRICSASLVYPCCRNTLAACSYGPEFKLRLAGQPGAPGGLIPHVPRWRALGVCEAVVGQPRDGEALRPCRWIVSEERGGGVGEVHARRDRLPAKVDAAAHRRDIASIARPGSLPRAGAGQEKDPPVKCSRASIVVRLRATSPVEVKPLASRTGPLTTAALRRSEDPPGLCSCAPAALRLPSVALRKVTIPSCVRRPSRGTSPSTVIVLPPTRVWFS